MPLIEFKCLPRNLSSEKKARIATKVVEAIMTEIEAPLEAYTFTCEEIAQEDWPAVISPTLENRSEFIVMDKGKII